MDSGTAAGQQVDPVASGLALIKGRMPLTYAEIQRRAAGSLGRAVFTLVRRALRGEPDCFYAVEGGHVVGTPFAQSDVTDDVARLMVQFGAGFLILWPMAEVAHGAD